VDADDRILQKAPRLSPSLPATGDSHDKTPAMNDDLLPDLIVAVGQQLVSPQTPYVAKALERLLKLGINESEAKTQIALCLGEEMDQVLRKRRPFDENAYRASLDGLPMKEEG
jgi:hypothetical protein